MKVAQRYLIFFFLLIMLPYAVVFGLLKYYDSDGLLIIGWIVLFPLITFPIWRNKLKLAQEKEKQSV
jgi:hypothetical protein